MSAVVSSSRAALLGDRRDDVIQVLQTFAGSMDGIDHVVLSSIDGFALAQASGDARHGDRLAAMTSSMLGLAVAVGRELSLGSLEVLMMDASDGKVLMLSLPTEPRPLLLMVGCNRRAVTGSVLWGAKDCGQKVLAALMRG
ncbi:MAG: roadblock/LC7 domain-containing protein [Pseudoxanthomonas sp.]